MNKPTTSPWRVIRPHPWRQIHRPKADVYLARARVFKRDGIWHVEATDSLGNVFFTDNTAHWRTILDLANKAVTAYDFMARCSRARRLGSFNKLRAAAVRRTPETRVQAVLHAAQVLAIQNGAGR